MAYMGKIDTMSDNIYRYLNFNEIKSFQDSADRARKIPVLDVRDVA